MLHVLEYSSSVWGPDRKEDILKLERVQQKFTKILFYRVFASNEYPLNLPSYSARLEVLRLKSLFCRRFVVDLVKAFKMLKGEIRLELPCTWIFSPKHCRGFSLNLSLSRVQGWRKRIYQNSLSARSVRLLNSLPPNLIDPTHLQSSRKNFLKLIYVIR